MIIGIDMGHPLSGGGTGAVGIRKETDCNRDVGKRVISKLEALGHKVVNCTTDYAKTQSQALSDRVALANKQKLDLFVSIHFNCGGGNGAEVFTYGGRDFPQARNVLNNMVALGYKNRGLKDGSKLYVVRRSKAKAMLIECCFIDSKIDMDIYNAENLANAIVKGLVGATVTQNNVSKSVDNSSIDGKTGICTASALNVRELPNTDSRIIGKIRLGGNIRLFKKVGDWYSIYYGEHGGYVSAQYVKMI